MTLLHKELMSHRSDFGNVEREGQMAMNALFNVRRDLYDKVSGTENDPFYDNNRLTDFWDWIATTLTEEQENGYE
jgi:hypothetical protein